MIAACLRPDVVGPMVIAGAPLSYWAGVRGKNAMRYLGGWYGGSWLDRMMSDMGNGVFDAAWLVGNFDNLNPANTFWTKQYNVWVDPEQEKDRYLQFEKWWGDFVVLRGEEMQWMVDNLFIGNKFSTGQIVTSDGIRLDMREVKSPIICFCSHGDNITPPQQALDWILDNYRSVDDIRECGQRIFYNIDPEGRPSGDFRRHQGGREESCRVHQQHGAYRRDAPWAVRDRDHAEAGHRGGE